MKKSNESASYVACSLFLLACVNYASHYGTRWEFGRYGLPRPLVSADGQTYLDGWPVDPITAAQIRAGVEEEVMLFIAAILVVLATLIARMRLRTRRLRRELEYYRAGLERLRKERY